MADTASSSSDESVDVSNEKFDPLRALYSHRVVIPVPGAPLYDNINKFEAISKGISKKRPENSKNIADATEVPKRGFLPHQEPVRGKIQNDRIISRHNVLTKMQNVYGPLELLHSCMETRKKVKVYTRSARGIRGYIEAYVAAFDKHWNLALEDCFEVWTRKVKRKAPALGIATKLEVNEEDRPKVIVKECNGKTETLERHVPQILLRGEQVAVIVKIN